MNVTKLTAEYVKKHPFVRESLKQNITNYSKLSRVICTNLSELSGEHHEAVLIALRRITSQLQKSVQKNNYSDTISNLLKKTSLTIRNNMVVLILNKDIKFTRIIELQKEADLLQERIHTIRSENATTLIIPKSLEKKAERLFKNNIEKHSDKLVEVVLKSPEQLEKVPGVTGYLYSLFAENGINIVETMSCWTDTLFVIHQKDLQQVVDILSF